MRWSECSFAFLMDYIVLEIGAFNIHILKNVHYYQIGNLDLAELLVAAVLYINFEGQQII